MSGNRGDRPGMDEGFRLLRDRQVDAGPDLDDYDLADVIIAHEDRFRDEQRLLFMLLVVLVEPFDRLCREHLRANCLLLNPVDLAEAAVVGLIADHFFGRRETPLRAVVRNHIRRIASRFTHDPTMYMWQPDEVGTEDSHVFHVACGVVNGLPIDARRVLRLAWVDQLPWREIEAVTGRHPEDIERILEQVLLRAQQILATQRGRAQQERAADDDGEMDSDA